MAGHSKWSNIQHRKGAQDKKKSNIFSKCVKEITIAAKLGDPNPENNARLRLAIQNAKQANMPLDNIKRALDKATSSGENLEEVRYEGFGNGSVPIIVDCLTDNTNRTFTEVKNIFGKGGGNLGSEGSVSFMFKHVGIIVYPDTVMEFEKMFNNAIEASAEDVIHIEGEKNKNGLYKILTNVKDFGSALPILEKSIGEIKEAHLGYIPITRTEDIDDETLEKLSRLIETLEDHDDVQRVFTGVDDE
ncbi:MAG: YebC/PmpR family DNA-binding transcriptional regulator [Alphaproteobacteria bacterium]|nr:YebC/PmpR family DNA-binding transcriptional regulator [Alphaproteobacteria bacterium]MBL0717724.1 YebC/PmpR family DNA-binding transcriptional regulator [Alphaproteobacteria bacterium]